MADRSKVVRYFESLASHFDTTKVGIEDYPSHFHEILSDLTSSDEEKTDVRESMELWDKDPQFVLPWGNDYWLNESGEVVSS